MLDKDELYELIDEDEEMTDEEKREVYYAEISNDEMDQQYEANSFP